MEPKEALTKSEEDFVRLILKGLTNKEIARLVGCSVRDVIQNRARIFNKLGIKIGPEIGRVPSGALNTFKE